MGAEAGPATAQAQDNGHDLARGAGHGAAVEVDGEAVLGEASGHVAGGGDLGQDLPPSLGQGGERGPVGVGRVAHHCRLGVGLTARLRVGVGSRLLQQLVDGVAVGVLAAVAVVDAMSSE